MKRAQRTVHAYLWPVLAVIMAITIVVAVMARERTALEPAPAPAQDSR